MPAPSLEKPHLLQITALEGLPGSLGSPVLPRRRRKGKQVQQLGLSTRQEQTLRKKRQLQKAHGSQQAGAGHLQLLRMATQGAGSGGRRRSTFIEGFLCGETPGLPQSPTRASPVLTSAWELRVTEASNQTFPPAATACACSIHTYQA